MPVKLGISTGINIEVCFPITLSIATTHLLHVHLCFLIAQVHDHTLVFHTEEV